MKQKITVQDYRADLNEDGTYDITYIPVEAGDPARYFRGPEGLLGFFPRAEDKNVYKWAGAFWEVWDNTGSKYLRSMIESTYSEEGALALETLLTRTKPSESSLEGRYYKDSPEPRENVQVLVEVDPSEDDSMVYLVRTDRGGWFWNTKPELSDGDKSMPGDSWSAAMALARSSVRVVS